MSKQRKQKTNYTQEQRLDYAKLMINEGYSNKQIMEISGAGSSAKRLSSKTYVFLNMG